MDSARSDHPAVQAQLDRLATLSVPRGRLSLEPTRSLLARLGDPQRRLPPVFHVAGTNGKGSTCAFLRAALEAAGHRVHAYTSPHLVRFNERFRLTGRLIDDQPLADLLGEVLDAAQGIGASFFEATTAAAFLAFARTPADACIVEVGLGGRLDATNVLEAPAVCGIASLGIDHEAFLLVPEAGAPDEPLARIAWEKAGIAKAGVPLVTLGYPRAAAATIAQTAAAVNAPWLARGVAWDSAPRTDVIVYRDNSRPGEDEALHLPLPAMPGAHQADNYALAVAMLRHQDRLAVPSRALAEAARTARWPARLHRLRPGPLAALAGDRTVWLDGGHNRDAGDALAAFFARVPAPAAAPCANAAQPRSPDRTALHLIVGMLASKDPRAIIEPLAGALLSITAVPVPGHDGHEPEVFGDLAGSLGLPFSRASDTAAALRALPAGADALIAGSLYLAGQVLEANGERPD